MRSLTLTYSLPPPDILWLYGSISAVTRPPKNPCQKAQERARLQPRAKWRRRLRDWPAPRVGRRATQLRARVYVEGQEGTGVQERAGLENRRAP